MSQPKRRFKTPIWAFTGLILGLLVGFIIGSATSSLSSYLDSLAPEYNSASAIDEVAEFVRANNRWPKSWTELNSPPLEGVVVNWSIDIESCDRHDVMTAVVPVTRLYLTYPHAESQLDALWQAVQESRDALRESRSNQQLQLTSDARDG